MLKAYQADLLAQTVADRRQEDPVGSLLFIDHNMSAYLQQQGYWNMVMEMPANDMSVNDMAGDDDDSWKSQFEAADAFDNIETQIAGLGEIEAVQQIYVEHTKAAIDSLGK